MLPRKYRLTAAADFRRVHAQGHCWSSRIVVLCKHPNNLPWPRVGFSVSKRIGNAVVRNRTKRLMREAVRPLCDLVEPGWDVIIIARHAILDADLEAIEGSTVGLLRKARLLRSEDGATRVETR